MSDLLSIGASGVRAYQTALGVVSDNIANAGTAGYARRTATLKEITPAGVVGLMSLTPQAGNGVGVDAIARQADAYKASAVRTASADLARTEAGSTWLTRVQSVLTQGAVGTRMTGFFTAAQQLGADPTSSAARSAVLAQADATAQAFQSTAAALSDAGTELDAVAGDATRQLSQLGESLAKVNEGLGRALAGSSGAANLLDKRDQILEEMSALADVSAQFDSAGRVTARLGGTQGPVLVSGSNAATVTASRNDDGTLGFVVHGDTGDQPYVPNGGVLAGLVEGAQRIREASTGLETIAAQFVSTVNTQLQAGDDLAGDDGQALFTVETPATSMTLAFNDPKLIAAAARDGGTRDGSNMIQLQSQRTASGLEDAATALTASVAAAIDARATIAEAQTAIRDSAVSARDAVSGVDLDQEAVDLLRFQQAYQASSRVIQVARETFQSILSIQ